MPLGVFTPSSEYSLASFIPTELTLVVELQSVVFVRAWLARLFELRLP